MRLSWTSLSLSLTFAPFLACTVAPENPFDPATDCLEQAPARLSGVVQAVNQALENGEIPDAAICDLFDGPHAGTVVALRGTSGCAASAGLDTADTLDDGAFAFDGLQPGTYALTFLRAGYEVPAAAEYELGPGEDLVLAPQCALNRRPPDRPTVLALPTVIGADDASRVQVTAIPGLTYVVVQAALDDSGERNTTVLDCVETCETPLNLVVGDDLPARRPWAVEVTAVDDLGNESEVNRQVVIRDTLAPEAPTGLTLVAGLDNVVANWDSPIAAPGDDVAIAWRISYGLVPRANTGDPLCPHGRPVDGDPFDRAAFALEGESPLQSAVTSQTLSGLLPGTDVFVHVAAVDEVGNAGCFSLAAVARPDEVTPRVVDQAVAARSLALDMAEERGIFAYALGAGGLVVVDRAGTEHVLTGHQALAVEVDEGRVVAAAGAEGLWVIPLDELGVPGTESILARGDVRDVHKTAGGFLLGQSGGLQFVDAALDGGASVSFTGAATRVLTDAARVMAIVEQTGQNPRLLIFEDQAEVASTTLLPGNGARLDLARIGDDLLVTLGTRGVARFDRNGDLVEQRELPGRANASDVLTYDDLAVVIAGEGIDDGALGGAFFLEPGGLNLVGRAFASPSFARGVVRENGLCTTENDALVCLSTAALPVVAATERLALGDVEEAFLEGAELWSRLEVGDVLAGDQARYDGSVSAAVALAVSTDGLAVVVNAAGEVHTATRDAPSDQIAKADLAPALTGLTPPLRGFAVLEDHALFVALRDDAGNAALARLVLTRSFNGALTFAAPTVRTLDDVTELTRLSVARGAARVATIPFGVVSVAQKNISSARADAVGQQSAPTEATDLVVETSGRVLVSGAFEDGQGTIIRDGFFVVGDAGEVRPLQEDLDVPFTNLVATADRVIAGAVNTGLIALDPVVDELGADALSPVLAIPEVTQVRGASASARGLVAADGARGVVRVIFR